jgi:SAM-dependent methyltransferase
MEIKEYRNMFELEDHHWWFQGRLMMTENLLRTCILPTYDHRRPRLLDLGCGTGLFLQRRQADCEALGIDLSPEALSYCHQRQIRSVARADAARLPFGDESFDIVTAFDLIEHLPDDRALVREIHRVLKPGGFMMATVPAHPLLWTGHDVSLHHHRRYQRRTFEILFDPPAWETVRMSALFSLIFPPAALIRLARHVLSNDRQPHSDTHPTAEWLNRLMIRLHRLEADWLTRHDLPIGISLATIRRKRA